jgi:hypothetical protein
MAEDTDAKLVVTTFTSRPRSHPPAMAITDVTTEGDVILNLQHSRLRVSSFILASASPVFKEGFRTAQHPKEFQLEDNSTAMTRLCFLLHHKRDPKDPSSLGTEITVGAEELFSLVVLAKKYECVDAVRAVGSNLFSYFAYSSAATGIPIDALLYFVGTACVLEDPRQFAMLTRRLVLDYTTRFSGIAMHPVIPTLPSFILRTFPSLPSTVIAANKPIVRLEEQRRIAIMLFRDDLLKITCVRHCCLPYTVPSFLHDLYGFPQLPRDGKLSLRALLKMTGARSNVVTNYGGSHVVRGSSTKDFCNMVSSVAHGLCLTCVRAEKFVNGPCEHHELLKQCVENDPIF